MLVACLFSTVHGRTAEEKDAMKKSIRMKTTRQLKEIFDELDIGHKGLSKEELQTMAYKEDAVGRWETLHLEKKKKPRPASRGGGGGGGGMPGMEGMGDVPGMEDMMRQMKGDFSGEADPEKRRILEKLAKKGRFVWRRQQHGPRTGQKHGDNDGRNQNGEAGRGRRQHHPKRKSSVGKFSRRAKHLPTPYIVLYQIMLLWGGGAVGRLRDFVLWRASSARSTSVLGEVIVCEVIVFFRV